MFNSLSIIDDIKGTMDNIKEVTTSWFELIQIAMTPLPAPFQTLLLIAIPIIIFLIALSFWDKVT